MASNEDVSQIDPELAKIFEQHGKPKSFLPTRERIDVFRRRFEVGTERFMKSPFVRRALNADQSPPWNESDYLISVRDASKIKIRVYCPKIVPPCGAPALVFMHGGGWCMGGLDTDAFSCQLMCMKLRFMVFNVAYRLYPDVAFLIPITDCYDAVKWVAENAQTYSGNLSKRFIVGGNSGGSTFASVSAHLARDAKLSPPITGQFLGCPVLTDEYEDSDGKIRCRYVDRCVSFEENKNAPLQDQATKERMREFSEPDLKSPYLSAFHFPSHVGIAPAYMQVCGLDPWRDGGYIYADLLREAGSRAKVDSYPGLPHCWWTPYWMISATQRWLKDTIAGAEWLLEQSKEVSEQETSNSKL